MENKIEVLDSIPRKDDTVKQKKNPFLVSKKKTIKRDARDVYPNEIKKGLNKVDNVGKNPLDILFKEVDSKIEGQIEDISLDLLFEKLCEEENDIDRFKKRYLVIEKLMNYLIEIQRLSCINQKNSKDPNLIAISLHDIKTFSKIINLVIIHGIYPALGNLNIGIPLNKRRLKEFSNTHKQIKIEKIPNELSNTKRFHKEELLLTLVYEKFLQIFLIDSDVKDLLLRGTGIFDFLTIALTLSCVPYFSENVRNKVIQEFKTIESIPDTYELFQTYTLLAFSSSETYFKVYVLSKLKLLHYNAPRKDGVLSLIEFVLGLRDNEEINISKFENVADVILAKPKNIGTVQYFESIGAQLYDLLININKPSVTSCVTFILERLWEKNRLVAQDFIFKIIWTKFNPVDIEDSDVIVLEAQLNNAVNVVLSLTQKSSNPQFLSHSISPILLSLWYYYVFLKLNNKSSEVINGIIVSYLTVTRDLYIHGDKELSSLDTISKNLLVEGGDLWEFNIGPNELVQINKKLPGINDVTKDQRLNKFFSDIEKHCEYFISILLNMDEVIINRIFIIILKRYLQSGEDSILSNNEDPYFILVDLRLLESICKNFKEDLAKTPLELLELVKSLLESFKPNSKEPNSLFSSTLQEDEDSDDEDNYEHMAPINAELIPTVLELLSAILSESDGQFDKRSIELLNNIVGYLSKIGEATESSVSNSSRALKDRIELLLNGEKPTNTIEEEHKKILKRAITSLNDPLVPIRAHGLYLLRLLVESESEIISLKFAIELHLNQLSDSDPFIYLNVIKGLESLLNWNETIVLPILIALYLNEDKDTSLDERLRIGEVILRFIQSSNELFSGQSAVLITNATLKIIRKDVASETIDDRLRMSSMSLLGVCCNVNPLGILDQIENALDCALGILHLETSKESSIMRRAAVVLINDLILGVSNVDNFQFPPKYRESVINTLNYITETDNDLLVREQAKKVLETINELVKEALELLQDDLDTSSYKMFKLNIN